MSERSRAGARDGLGMPEDDWIYERCRFGPGTPGERTLVNSRSLMLGFGAMLAALLATAVILEIALRLLPAEIRGYTTAGRAFIREKEFVYDEQTNRDGFHDVDHNPGRSADRRVLLIGDSYVEALSMQIPETVGRRLEAELRRRSGLQYDVISLGLGGSGQSRQYKSLEKWGPVYRPDVVVTLFLTLNDVLDDSPELKRLGNLNDRRMFRRRPGLAQSEVRPRTRTLARELGAEPLHFLPPGPPLQPEPQGRRARAAHPIRLLRIQ